MLNFITGKLDVNFLACVDESYFKFGASTSNRYLEGFVLCKSSHWRANHWWSCDAKVGIVSYNLSL